MKKSDITREIARRKGISQKKARIIVDGVFQAMAEALTRGEKVEIRGLGTFKIKKKPSRFVRMKCDVLVVGAGPAGATAAYLLARGGAKVLMVDTRKVPGVPVQCAEFVPLQLESLFPEFFPGEVTAQRVHHMTHFTPWGEVFSVKSEGYVLHRDRFDGNLVRLAQKAGAELKLKTRFTGFAEGRVFLKDLRSGISYSVDAEFVVGADGARSLVARLSGEATEEFLPTAQITVPLGEKLCDLLIFFRDYIPGGYGWIFPRGDHANVGVGVDPRYPVRVGEVLSRFVEEVRSLGLIRGSEIRRSGGWIPAEGMKEPLRGRIMLVGSAGRLSAVPCAGRRSDA